MYFFQGKYSRSGVSQYLGARLKEILPQTSGFYLLYSPHFLHRYYVGMSRDLRERMSIRASALHHVGITNEMLHDFQIALVSCLVSEHGHTLTRIDLQQYGAQGFHIIEGQHLGNAADPDINLENVLMIVCDNALRAHDKALRNLELPSAIQAPNTGLDIQVNMRLGMNLPFPNLPVRVNVGVGRYLALLE